MQAPLSHKWDSQLQQGRPPLLAVCRFMRVLLWSKPRGTGEDSSPDHNSSSVSLLTGLSIVMRICEIWTVVISVYFLDP